MSAARSFVRLAICGLFINAIVVACTVKEENGDGSDVTCNPGDKKDCSCSDGSDGLKTCNSSGDGYKACVCAPGTGGTTGAGGDTSPTAGTKAYAGSGGSAGTTYGGTDAGGAPIDGVVGGAAGEGVGGAPDDTPLECQDPAGDCEACYFGGCCDVYAPCVNDADEACLQELADVLSCTDAIKAERDVKTADLQACAQMVGNTQGSWSASLSPLTVDVINCIAGEAGWEGKAWAATGTCHVSCFDK